MQRIFACGDFFFFFSSTAVKVGTESKQALKISVPALTLVPVPGDIIKTQSEKLLVMQLFSLTESRIYQLRFIPFFKNSSSRTLLSVSHTKAFSAWEHFNMVCQPAC